jgi:hypothetical protein
MPHSDRDAQTIEVGHEAKPPRLRAPTGKTRPAVESGARTLQPPAFSAQRRDWFIDPCFWCSAGRVRNPDLSEHKYLTARDGGGHSLDA